MNYLIALALALVVAIPLSLFGGVVLHDLWRWFAVPVFHLPELSVVQAVGLNILGSFFMIGLKRDGVADEEGAPISNVLVTMIGGAIGLLFVWGYAALWNSLFLAQ